MQFTRLRPRVTHPLSVAHHPSANPLIQVILSFLGETQYSVVVTGYTPPMFFSFTINSLLESVHEYTLESTDVNVTLVKLKIISRRRSYFFHVS